MITVSQRIDYMQQSPELFKKLIEIDTVLKKSPIEESIHDLVKIRASQINGCAFCLDMHIKQATIRGERPLRIIISLSGASRRYSARASAQLWLGRKR
jgi:AhpD family alkylhydroperoxidase